MESMVKQLEAHLHEEPKLWSFIVLYHKQIMNARRGSKERNLTWRIQEESNFWSTSWSSFHAYYMSFRSSGSQQSNTSNGTQIGVEMKKLEPFEANHTKLKANFADYEMIRWWLWNQPLAAKWRPSACKFLQPSCMPAKSSWVLPDICDRHF